jgi:uncharacterized protein YbjT (DUF2867 family)
MTAILITGATGKQGDSVIKNLLEKIAPFKILVVTRDPNSTAKLAQKSSNITLIQGDLEDPAAIFENVKYQTSTRVWGVFSVQVSVPPKTISIHLTNMEQTANSKNANDDKRCQGIALIESIKQGVKYFVYSSVDRGGERSNQNPNPVPHFILEHETEKHLKEKSKGTEMEWTILRPVACFFVYFVGEFHAGLRRKGLYNCMEDVSEGQAIAVGLNQ